MFCVSRNRAWWPGGCCCAGCWARRSFRWWRGPMRARRSAIDNFKFDPTPLTIEKGTEVTWTNHDDIPHSIVVNALGVHSKAMDTDGKFTYKFDKTGTFFYVCGLHPFMQAKVVVK